MAVKNFKELVVWQKSMELTLIIYHLVKHFPKEEMYALTSQICRAAVSIPSNIAEGVSRNSIKEKVRFLEIAYGSLMEVLCQLELSLDLGYLTNDEMNTFEGKIETIAKLISGLKKSIS